MNRLRLLSTAAVLLIGTATAMAQDLKKDESPAASPAPAAQQKAPAEKLAPNMKAGEKNAETHKAPETTGQTSKESAPETGKSAEPKAGMNKPSDANGSADVKSRTDADVKAKTDSAADEKAGAASTSSQSTTGQGAASGSAKLSTDQRTKITTILKQKKVEPAHLNVSVSVGTRIPGSVRFYPLPREVVVIYPEWRGYDYILVGDQIVVVDPRSHEIVAILEA